MLNRAPRPSTHPASNPAEDFFRDNPEDSIRWVRLMDRCRGAQPEVFQALIHKGEPPSLETLLDVMKDDPAALAEDWALQAWATWDQDAPSEARNLAARALTLDPSHDDARVLEILLNLEGEPRLQALQVETDRQREALPEPALDAIAAGRGGEIHEVFRLHRCLAEQVHVLVEMERWEECIALIDEVFTESNEDSFGLFPALAQAALTTNDLDVLDTWVDELGAEYPGLQEWLQVYLSQTGDEPGAAFQALRRARKAFPQMELAFLKWYEAILKTPLMNPDTFPPPVFPADARAAGVFAILAPPFMASPEFMAWLKRMRTLR